MIFMSRLLISELDRLEKAFATSVEKHASGSHDVRHLAASGTHDCWSILGTSC